MNTEVTKKITSFFEQFPKVTYSKGSTILQPEDPLDYIYNIDTGYVKSYSVNEDGYDLIINIFKPLSFFPITETLAKKINPYYFEAITDTVLCKAPTQKVHQFIQNDNAVLFDLTRRISSGLEAFMIRTQYLIRANATQKVTSTLVILARRFGTKINSNEIKILLPQTQEDIGNFSGTSRETASTEMKKLEKQALIAKENKYIVIKDFEKIRALSAIYYEDHPLPYNF